MHVVVVGGGITGLSLAHRLVERSRREGRPFELTLLEANARAGGHACTVREADFVVEAGPNGFLDHPDEPALRALVGELGLESRLIEACPGARRRFLFLGGRLRRIPDSPATLIATDALSIAGKLRLLLEPWARPAAAGCEESVYAFASRHLGREAAETLVDPAVAGISAGDSHALSAEASFPKMVELERAYGSLLRALLRRRGPGRARLMSFAGGMGTLIGTLSDLLGPALRTGWSARRIERRGPRWRVVGERGGELAADAVVLACPAWCAAPLVAAESPGLARLLGSIPAAGLAVAALAFRRADVPHPLDGYGCLVARREGLHTLGVVWESSLFAGRAPEREVLLRVMLGGARHPETVELPEAGIVDLARRELRRILGVEAAPSRTWVWRWPRSIAQYTLGHHARAGEARALAALLPGLELCGTSYDGVSFAAAVASAEQCAGRLLAGMPSLRPEAAAEPPRRKARAGEEVEA